MRLVGLFLLVQAVLLTIVTTTAAVGLAQRRPAVIVGSRGLPLEKQASRQSRLLSLKYTRKETVKNGQGGSNTNNAMQRREESGMLKQHLSTKRNNAHAAPSLSQRQVGLSILQAGEYDAIWKVPVQLYSGKALNLIYDTGSSIMIVNRDAYKPSSLAKITGSTYSISYMDGTASDGDIWLDYVTIGGLTLWTSLVWAKDNFLDPSLGSDGILGVGFSSGTTIASLIEGMVSSFTMLNDVICMTMTSHGEGALQFGALDATIVNEIKYTDVLVKHNHAWDTTASINGVPFDTIIDTGTTYAFLPIKVAQDLFTKLGLKSLKTKDGKDSPDILWGLCSGKGAPALSVMIGSIPTPFTISSKNAAAWNENDCRLSIIGTSDLDAGGYGILGAAFLKNVHLVMDRGLYKMGFAQRIVRPDEQ